MYKDSELRNQKSECVFCGCTQTDCSECIERTGEPCHWISEGICSACVQDIKALSIRQPWAWLIVNGYKSIENRSWKTKYRGPFLIHASKTFDHDGYDWIVNNFVNTPLPGKESISTKKGLLGHYRTGGFVGISELIACLDQSDDPFFTGPYGFELSNVHPIEFIEYPGSLKFFNVPDSVINQIELKSDN